MDSVLIRSFDGEVMVRDRTVIKNAIERQSQLPVWLCHLWQRLKSDKLGLVLGAGVSIDAGIPLWKTLVDRLASKEENAKEAIAAHRDQGFHDTYITQIIFSLHQKRMKSAQSSVPPQYEQYQIESTWMESVHSELYRDLNGLDFDNILSKHPYLRELGELVYRSGFTVNFNFDDLVDEATIRYAKQMSCEQPEIISSPKKETRLHAPVIYHINGSLPREPRRRRSDSLIFTEDAFADVLISPASYEAEFMMSRFATRTFLLLGTSLSDNSLKNLLRASKKRSPANHHYIVYWERPDGFRSAEQRQQIFDVNLEVYNLISIFLNSQELAELIAFLNVQDEGEFESEMEKLAGEFFRRRYYLVGSVVSGKSTNLEELRCFSTFEEWLGRPPAKMYQDHASLSPKERAEIDDWLFQQLRAKNDRIKKTGVGIHIMDRAFLDLFAFSKDAAENLSKIEKIRSKVLVGGQLTDGHILFLTASEEVLSDRQARRGRLKGEVGDMKIEYDGSKLYEQSVILQAVYSPDEASLFDTSRESPEITCNRIARKILLGTYTPFKFTVRLSEIEAQGGVL